MIQCGTGCGRSARWWLVMAPARETPRCQDCLDQVMRGRSGAEHIQRVRPCGANVVLKDWTLGR
jgi:hypothetical protein